MSKGILATVKTVGTSFEDAGYPGTAITIQKIGKGGNSLKVLYKTAGGITGSFPLGTGLLPDDQKVRTALVRNIVKTRRNALAR